MPARNRPQSNAILYTLIAFVGLFIIAAAVGVIYYVKYEDQRTIANDSRNDLNEYADRGERVKIGATVGTKQRRTSWLGTMLNYLDEMANQIIGGPSKDTSAEEKVNLVNTEVESIKQLLAREYPDIEFVDPNAAGLVHIIRRLKAKLDNVSEAALALEKQLEDLHNRFNDAQESSSQAYDTLLAEKDKFERQVNEIKQMYSELESGLRKDTGQQIQDLMNQRDKARVERDTLETELGKMRAELAVARDKIALLQREIQATMPSPDPNAPAYRPDGKIIMVEDRIVHLNIGRDERVYRGLTFKVYDRGMPIPSDGKGKAEIKVFDVRKNFSAARVLYSQTRNPILKDDIVANLIWDKDKANIFMIAGEFDLGNDGYVDYDAVEKIKGLIVTWGGRVSNTLSVDTDFLVLGKPPRVLRKPTFADTQADPMAMEKHEASLKRLAEYKQVLNQARALGVPVFNTERFLHFIGYKSQAGRPTAF